MVAAGVSVPRKKSESRQINFRLSNELADALDESASLFDNDVSSILRMMIAEHVAEYLSRGKKARDDRIREMPKKHGR